MTTTPDCLRIMQRAEYCLRRISQGDPRALENAENIAIDLQIELKASGWDLADEQE